MSANYICFFFFVNFLIVNSLAIHIAKIICNLYIIYFIYSYDSTGMMDEAKLKSNIAGFDKVQQNLCSLLIFIEQFYNIVCLSNPCI